MLPNTKKYYDTFSTCYTVENNQQVIDYSNRLPISETNRSANFGRPREGEMGPRHSLGRQSTCAEAARSLAGQTIVVYYYER